MFRLAAVAAAGAVTASSLAGCGSVPAAPNPSAVRKRGGTFSHGATGGGLADTLQPHAPVTNPDIARVANLYEPLLTWDADYKIAPALATSVKPNADATVWTAELRHGVEFHNGKTMTAEDVLASMAALTDPKTGVGGALTAVLDMKNSRAVDPYTVRFALKRPYSVFDQLVAEYTTGIIPSDFDPKNPVGTGAFKTDTFTPGQLSRFRRFDDYWGGPAWVDELVIYDFADDAAKVDALLAGQVQSIDNLPPYLVDSIGKQGSSALVSDTGAWIPFTMRVDTKPLSDVRVRQALRLIVDRQQMIDQALDGYGFLGNDVFAPFDPAYDHSLPQRHQDIDQAKSLLKAAGQSDLQIEVVTSTGVGAGGVESANLFVSQARSAGLDVRLDKADPNTFYGGRYLKWDFAQDFWFTRNYLPQAASCTLPGALYNETHFQDKEYIALATQAEKTVDEAKRTDLLHQCQKIDYDRGGYIIWGFKKQVDGYSNLVSGLEPNRALPSSGYKFKDVAFVEGS